MNKLTVEGALPLFGPDTKAITIPDGMDLVTYIESLLHENERLIGVIKEIDACNLQWEFGSALSDKVDAIIKDCRNKQSDAAFLPIKDLEEAKRLKPLIQEELAKRSQNRLPPEIKGGVTYIAHVITGVSGGHWSCNICGPMTCTAQLPKTRGDNE